MARHELSHELFELIVPAACPSITIAPITLDGDSSSDDTLCVPQQFCSSVRHIFDLFPATRPREPCHPGTRSLDRFEKCLFSYYCAGRGCAQRGCCHAQVGQRDCKVGFLRSVLDIIQSMLFAIAPNRQADSSSSHCTEPNWGVLLGNSSIR